MNSYTRRAYGLAMTRSKSLSDAQNAAARIVVRRLLKDRFAGDQSACAEALNVSQPTLSNFLSGGRGTGPKMIAGVAALDPEGAVAIFAGRDLSSTKQEPADEPSPRREVTPARREEREARLSNVREMLYKRYDRAAVNEVIAESEFVDGLNVSELEAFDRLDELLRLHRAETSGALVTGKIPGHAKDPPPVGTLPAAVRSASMTTAQQEAFRTKAEKLGKRATKPAGERKRAGE